MKQQKTDWAADTARGRDYAATLIQRARDEASPMPITTGLREMRQRGDNDALAVGFFTEVAVRAMR